MLQSTDTLLGRRLEEVEVFVNVLSFFRPLWDPSVYLEEYHISSQEHE